MMAVTLRALVVLLACLVALPVGCSGSESQLPDKNADALQWVGTWDTNWGEMVVHADGEIVTANYEHDDGKLDAVAKGKGLSGTWSESPSYKPPHDAGDVELTLATDAQSFTGRWRYGSDGDWEGDWTGTRVN